VRLPAGAALGVEALLRWRAPEPGAVSFARTPSGITGQLGDWAIEEAASQLSEWRRRSPAMDGLFVSVDLSAAQRRDRDVVGYVASVLAADGLRGSSLCLELAESVVMADPKTLSTMLQGLQGLGVDIALDRFGLEFASLAYLKRLSVTTVKIDPSIVATVAEPDSASASLVAAAVAIARTLKISTVACGVETPAQAARLAELGCDAAQGNCYSRPVAADELPDVVARLGARRADLASA
jgi:EAL domain-containing protein (putative c-di-GMP-specific phosphodiesterase class I)